VSALREVNASNTDDIMRADALCETMLGKLREMRAIRSDRVAEAFSRRDWCTGARAL
jgi:hypothetical protein